MTSDRDADLIVVGGGPAGVMTGLLFARAGCRVRILEKHKDFFRDFRGDTVHPSTMEILDQLGMLQRFLQRPHNKVDRARASAGRPGLDDRRSGAPENARAVHRDDAAMGISRLPARRSCGVSGLSARNGSTRRRLRRGRRQGRRGAIRGRTRTARAPDDRCRWTIFDIAPDASAGRSWRPDRCFLVPHREKKSRSAGPCAATSRAAGSSL